MKQLSQQCCEVCRTGAPKVTPEEAVELLKQLPEWAVVEWDGVARLRRQYRFADFAAALAFTNRVGAMAEAQQHHPDITTRWGAVELSWWTHKIGGLHRNDFVCAARSDELFEHAD